MQISVSGKQIDIGNSLKEYVNEIVDRKITKYFDHPINTDIVFSRESILFRVDIIVNEGTGVIPIIKANAQDDEIYSAFDATINKIQKQLRRYKGKIRNHHKRKISEIDFEQNTIKGKKYVISNLPKYVDDNELSEQADNPLIIAEKPTNIEHLTVSEAVMKMDLANLPALLFINTANNKMNLVYHRIDGNISWIDTNDN